ncbi:MAG: glycogen/starch/alpha-glucan phosphorylase [Bacteroidales bacterium]|nr:glycogen/starch/alpha-glucan phosphorylase [Bacteroidales bacterium]MBN2763916.1 glycogen/starch/alpha-glucan phosphorylase [Bacteroidales bacterium]
MKKTLDPSGVRIGRNADAIAMAFLNNLYYLQGCTLMNASHNDLYMALSYTVRDRMLASWIKGIQDIVESNINEYNKTVSYLSAEFLPGPHLANNLVCLGLYEETRKALNNLAVDLDELLTQEEEPGLGNGGLGRLASCFMDSLATLSINAIGYGIRYEFGIFDQEIHNGWQVEITDRWLRYGNPWEIVKPELSQEVGLGGYTESYYDDTGRYCVKWVPGRIVKGVPYDTPIIGYGNNKCNTMRLWKAEAVISFDLQDFNMGDYYAAVEDKISSETITKVLYPNDEIEAGKQLRLIQQYFFVCCSLKDMIRLHFSQNEEIDTFHKHFAIQMNDTHPSIAVAELMRLLVDEYQMDWDKAWKITIGAMSYTNHTLMPEALEKWKLDLFKDLLPRHLEIVYEINHRFLTDLKEKYPGDNDKLARMSIIDEASGKTIRMAHLACVGSHSINGVAALHTDLLKNHLLQEFYQLWPDKFHNVTNGITPRRWVNVSNQGLSSLITEYIGSRWLKEFHLHISDIEKFKDDPEFRKKWRDVKKKNKALLSSWIKNKTGVEVNPDSMFDIMVKRIHEYKRQHLNVLHVITLYNQLKDNPDIDRPSRTVLFGGKAAPGYFMAKLIIKLINSVGDVINNDKSINNRLKVVFIPNYNVQTGHMVYPAADLSEQISMAGKEASGTGNMKFNMNGALTIGTADGANVEIREQVGDDNFFLFGLKTNEVFTIKSRGYNPRYYYENNPMLRRVLDQISSGYFSDGDTNLFRPLVDSLLYQDEYMLLADYKSYVDCQQKAGQVFQDQEQWTARSIINVAHMGTFSSDCSIMEYAKNIWKIRGF